MNLSIVCVLCNTKHVISWLDGQRGKRKVKTCSKSFIHVPAWSRRAATSKANSGEAIGNCFQNSLLQNKVLLSLRTSRLPAWENKCKFSVGVGVLNSLFLSSSKFWWQKYWWGSLPSIAQFSHLPCAVPFVLLCRTFKGANGDSTLPRHEK